MEKVISILKRILEYFSVVFFVSALVILTANVLCRLILGHAIAGVYELVGLSGLLFGSAAIVTCAIMEGHVVVDLVVGHLRGVPHIIQLIIAELLELAYYAFMAYAGWILAVQKIVSNELADTTKIPLGIFRMYIAVCFILAVVVKISKIVYVKQRAKKQEELHEMSKEDQAKEAASDAATAAD